MKTLSNKSQKTLNTLRSKVDSFDRVRMPNILDIHNLLTEAGIIHDFDGDVATTLGGQNRAGILNTRKHGRTGKKIWIPSIRLEIDSSHPYFSQNSKNFASQIIDIIE